MNRGANPNHDLEISKIAAVLVHDKWAIEFCNVDQMVSSIAEMFAGLT